MRYARRQSPKEAPTQKRRLKTKPLVVVIGILLFCNLLWFIAWVIPSKSQPIENDEEVASVNGKPITREMWMVAMEEKIGRETLRELINKEVMAAAAKEYGIKVTDQEVDLELTLMHAGDQSAYTGLDAEKEREAIQSTLILEKVLTKDVVIEDAAIQENYDENAALYQVQTAHRTALIVVDSLEDAEQTLKELNDGSNFSILAKERSIDFASANLGGDVGYINEDTDFVDPKIVQTASTIDVGTVSEPVPLDDGNYAIVSVSDRLEGQTFKLKEVQEHIKRELALEQLPEKVNPEAFWKDFKAKWFYEE